MSKNFNNKKYLDVDGLKKFTSLIQGKVNSLLIQQLKLVDNKVGQISTDEATRVIGETNRNTAEGLRVTSENTRNTNETTRINAENIRKSSESVYSSSESTRVNNENNRVTAEQGRITSETSRKTYETSRINAENIRVTNETTRQTNEATRALQENLRQTGEVNKNIEEGVRKTNEVARQANETTRQTQESARQTSITNIQTQFNALAPASSTNAEVQLARTDIAGKTYASLQERLLADNKQQNILYSSIAGTYVTSDSVDGYAKNVVIEGNTYQNPALLSDIRSTGTKLADGRYEIPLLCINENISVGLKSVGLNAVTGQEEASSSRVSSIDFIKVKPSISYSRLVGTGLNAFVFFYDKYKNIISISNSTDKVVTTPSNCSYAKLRIDSTDTSLKTTIMESNIAITNHIDRLEHQITILSDYLLGKIGTVADRIIQLSDGKWYIEKNIGTYNFTGNEDWCIYNVNVNEVNTMAFTFTTSTCLSDALINPLAMLSNVLKYDSAMYNSDLEGIFLRSNVQLIAFRLNKSKLTTQDIVGFKNWLISNGVFVKYQLSKPVYIPLADDQQISLKTFATKTNILTLCEIEPTIKGDVPKSTSASINSINNHLDNVDSELEKIKKLEDATNLTVITDKGFVNIGETGNGYLSDLKLEGRTLNQIVTNGNFANGTTGWTGLGCSMSTANNTLTTTGNGSSNYIQPNTLTNIKAKNGNKIFMSAYVKSGSSTLTCSLMCNAGITQSFTSVASPSSSSYIKVYGIITLSGQIETSDLRLYVANNYTDSATANGKVMEVQNVMALDLTALGMTNYTADQINSMLGGYIEGLKSVGQDVDKLVVSSVCGSGNLIDLSKLVTGRLDSGVLGYQADSTIQITDNGFICTPKVTYRGVVSDYMIIEPSTSYYLNTICNATVQHTVVAFYDSNKKHISSTNLGSTTFICTFTCPSNTKYIRIWFDFYTNALNVPYTVSNITLNKGITPISYQTIQTDKKEILYLDTADSTWKKPVFRGIWSNGILTVGDTVDKHSDGKYYYHKRMFEKVLNGSEDWILLGNNTNCISFYITDSNTVAYSQIISDKLKTDTGVRTSTYDSEGIASRTSTGGYIVSILKSKLTTADVAGFKTYLSLNNITIVPQLATELVYECTPLDLSSFDNETNYYVESGVLSPRSTIKCQNYIGEIMNNMKEQISNLQNKLYTDNMTTMTMLINHEARLIAHSI